MEAVGYWNPVRWLH